MRNRRLFPILFGGGTSSPASLLSGLVAYWKLDEESGNRADATGRGNTLIDTNTVTYATGKVGNASQFTAVNAEYLSLASNADVTFGDGDWTIAGWFKLNGANAYDVLGKSQNTSNKRGFLLRNYYNGDFGLWLSANGINTTTLNAKYAGKLASNTFYFFIAEYDHLSDVARLSVNNGMANEIIHVGGVFNNSDISFKIGAANLPDGVYWDGLVDEVAIFKRLLSTAEKGALYNAGSGTTYPFAGVTGDAVQINEPQDYQVFQRVVNTGTIYINGIFTHTGTHTVTATVDGGAPQTITANAVNNFNGSIANVPQGQHTIVITIDGVGSYTKNYVGVGEVFAIAGQSNASGRGLNNQTYSHATLKAGMFGNNYAWHELTDPTDRSIGQLDSITADTGAEEPTGSPWPLLASQIMASQGVPVAFIPNAKGGSSIAFWTGDLTTALRTTPYYSMKYRCLKAHGIRYVLWHQGESDAGNSVPEATYNTALDNLANAIGTDLGAKLMPCKLQNLTYAGQTAINNAIATAWGDNANVVTGPDFTDIVPAFDHVHFHFDAEMQEAADRWYTAIATALGW